MPTVAIAGVGLIGGSFALAVRRAGFADRVLGISSPATIAEACRLGVIDRGVSIEEACAEADLLYLAQPILRIIEDCSRIAPYVRPGMLVTDAGSTKARIVEAARPFANGTFLGGHPMAGKESRGVSAADAALFKGRPYVLTPDDPAILERDECRQFLELLHAIGAKPIVLKPEEHDRVVAFTSHLPQVLSTALAVQLDSIAESRAVAGPAAIDMTRLALSSYDMWKDIFVTNLTEVSVAIDLFISNLKYLQANLTSLEAQRLFDSASDVARSLRKNS